MSHTMTETGMVLTETQEGVTMPADYSFVVVNDYVHSVDRHFEELQWLALGMATEIEKLRKGRFITEMLRWGDTETHHYIVGAYSTRELAIHAGEVEKSWRAGKYEYRIVEVIIDAPIADEMLINHNECKITSDLVTDNLTAKHP